MGCRHPDLKKNKFFKKKKLSVTPIYLNIINLLFTCEKLLNTKIPKILIINKPIYCN